MKVQHIEAMAPAVRAAPNVTDQPTVPADMPVGDPTKPAWALTKEQIEFLKTTIVGLWPAVAKYWPIIVAIAAAFGVTGGVVGHKMTASSPTAIVKEMDIDFTPLIKAMKENSDALLDKIDKGNAAVIAKIDRQPVPPGPNPTPTTPIVVEDFVEAQVGRTTRLPYKSAGPATFTVYPPERTDEVFTDAALIHITPQSDGEFSVVVQCVTQGAVASKRIKVRAGKGPQPPPKPPTPAPPIDDDVLSILKELQTEAKAAKVEFAQIHRNHMDVVRRLVALEKQPVPPKPDPPKPDPPNPAPIPLDGFRVLIVYTPADLTLAQKSGIISGSAVRKYLQDHCVVGPDGKTKDFWIIQSGLDVSAAPKWIGDVIQRHPGQKNWMVASDGKTGYDGPIPATADEALTVLKKVGGQ